MGQTERSQRAGGWRPEEICQRTCVHICIARGPRQQCGKARVGRGWVKRSMRGGGGGLGISVVKSIVKKKKRVGESQDYYNPVVKTTDCPTLIWL